jgi:hypothetical protein
MSRVVPIIGPMPTLRPACDCIIGMKNDGFDGIVRFMAHRHALLVHTVPPEHDVLQSPQNSSLLVTSTQSPPQTMFGALHTGAASICRASTAASTATASTSAASIVAASSPPPQATRAKGRARAGTSARVSMDKVNSDGAWIAATSRIDARRPWPRQGLVDRLAARGLVIVTAVRYTDRPWLGRPRRPGTSRWRWCAWATASS